MRTTTEISKKDNDDDDDYVDNDDASDSDDGDDVDGVPRWLTGKSSTFHDIQCERSQV